MTREEEGHFWLTPVPSVGLRPVPLGGVPVLAVSPPPSLAGYSFNLRLCPEHSSPEKHSAFPPSASLALLHPHCVDRVS